MRNLTNGDLSLGLANLLTERKAVVDTFAAGQLYGPMLAKKQAHIDALPEGLRGGKPLVDELAQVDGEHDGYGGAMFAYVEAILAAPSSTPEQRAAAQRVRDAFVPTRAVLGDSYAEEAAAAKKNRVKLIERENDLELFPIPGGKTLYDWAVAFVNKGDELDELLNQRSMLNVGSGVRTAAIALRSDTLKLLYQFRAAVQAEIEHKNLDKELESKIFSYFDELSARRPNKKSPAKPTPTP